MSFQEIKLLLMLFVQISEIFHEGTTNFGPLIQNIIETFLKPAFQVSGLYHIDIQTSARDWNHPVFHGGSLKSSHCNYLLLYIMNLSTVCYTVADLATSLVLPAKL